MTLNNFLIDADHDERVCKGKYRAVKPPAWIPDAAIEQVDLDVYGNYDVTEWAYEDEV